MVTDSVAGDAHAHKSTQASATGCTRRTPSTTRCSPTPSPRSSVPTSATSSCRWVCGWSGVVFGGVESVCVGWLLGEERVEAAGGSLITSYALDPPNKRDATAQGDGHQRPAGLRLHGPAPCGHPHLRHAGRCVWMERGRVCVFGGCWRPQVIHTKGGWLLSVCCVGVGVYEVKSFMPCNTHTRKSEPVHAGRAGRGGPADAPGPQDGRVPPRAAGMFVWGRGRWDGWCVWWQWGCGVCWGAVGVSWGWDVWVGCVGGGCLVTGVVVD